MKMHRTQICLTNKQHKMLKTITDYNGLSLAEYIRRIIDKEMERVEDKAFKKRK